MRSRRAPSDHWLLSETLGELAALLDADVELGEALKIAGHEHQGARIERQLDQVEREHAGGISLGTSFANSFPGLPPFCADLLNDAMERDVRDGEAHNHLHLAAMAERMGQYMERMNELRIDRGELRRLLFYPLAVIVVGLIVASVLLIFVIPQFDILFGSFGADLPQLTRLVMDLSEVVTNDGWLILGTPILAIIGWRYAYLHSHGVRKLHGPLLLHLPGLSSLFRLLVNAELAHTLAFASQAEMAPSRIIEATRQASRSAYARDWLEDARIRVEAGTSMADALAPSPLFAEKLLRLLRLGERGGSLDRLMGPLAQRYTNRLKSSRGLINLIEPLIITLLGLLIGCLVIAMYLPIFQLGSVV